MASIHSLDDNTDASDSGNNMAAWIGLTDSSLEGTFVWEDGTSFDYNNWSPNEPSGGNSEADCVHLYANGMWNDRQCNDFPSYFVCNRPDYTILFTIGISYVGIYDQFEVGFGNGGWENVSKSSIF